jgi:hypothetical protein
MLYPQFSNPQLFELKNKKKHEDMCLRAEGVKLTTGKGGGGLDRPEG